MPSINLLNLVKIGQLDPVPPSADMVQRMFISARRQLDDAGIAQASPATRFDCAYNAIRQAADLGLYINGFRTSRNRPGHHQTQIQCLVHTLGVDESTVRVLDGLRRQRNGSDYDAEPVTTAALQECLKQAKAILAMLEKVLKDRPEFEGSGP